jgi:multimeric flavodoxin WrbA
MNILILMGSYRKNGNTDQIVDLMQAELKKQAGQHNVPLEIETIYLGQHKIETCRGCRVCFDRGEEKCPLKDDLLAIRAKVQAADGVIAASPVYVDDISGLLKNWIDRMAFTCHRPEYAGKCAYGLTTYGSYHSRHAVGSLQVAFQTWGFQWIGDAEFRSGALLKPEETREQHLKKVEAAAQTFFQALYKRVYEVPSVRSLMTFRIQQLAWLKGDPEKYDFQYWNSKGWLEPQREFYVPHRAGKLKVAISRGLGQLFYKLMK